MERVLVAAAVLILVFGLFFRHEVWNEVVYFVQGDELAAYERYEERCYTPLTFEERLQELRVLVKKFDKQQRILNKSVFLKRYVSYEEVIKGLRAEVDTFAKLDHDNWFRFQTSRKHYAVFSEEHFTVNTMVDFGILVDEYFIDTDFPDALFFICCEDGRPSVTLVNGERAAPVDFQSFVDRLSIDLFDGTSIIFNINEGEEWAEWESVSLVTAFPAEEKRSLPKTARTLYVDLLSLSRLPLCTHALSCS